MTREEIHQVALKEIDRNSYLVLELTTGFGKTRLAIDLINHICNKLKKELSVLLLVAKRVHKQTWLDEITKWGGIKTSNITIECYESLKKYNNSTFDIIVADEMQHLSETRLDILSTIKLTHNFIGLSATIKKDMRDYFIYKYKAHVIKCGLKDAIEDNVLPEPKVYLIPIKLDTTVHKYKIDRFKRTIITTQKGYYDNISSLILWYKNKYLNSRNERIKTLWLSTAGKRLKWLSEQKEPVIKTLLDKCKYVRTLTFCSSIDQSERLGKFNITSKNKKSIEYLDMFNQNKIKHITSCAILNEGVNLYNCKVGIFGNLNSSEIITKQRIGRLLRHKNPIIIVPYYIGTREEELVNKMMEEYTKESIIVINNINEIKL